MYNIYIDVKFFFYSVFIDFVDNGYIVIYISYFFDNVFIDFVYNGQDFVFFLVLVDRYIFENVFGQDDVFDGDQGVNVDVGVNEGYIYQIIVFQLLNV